jgi:phosphoglucomutase
MTDSPWSAGTRSSLIFTANAPLKGLRIAGLAGTSAGCQDTSRAAQQLPLSAVKVETVSLKLVTASGWFAARPSGSESVYKIYAESFKGPAHLNALLSEAQALVDAAIGDSV